MYCVMRATVGKGRKTSKQRTFCLLLDGMAFL